ncbi:hypothetical protein BC937DRAFT_87461 [Endogone sp. FLAS-F59071]|nr:hypothetical protein BC937DRAFT_87461 [Endogone sp. FLAS-F59071]|eukprot:RUS12591.1 hypothetical protein BC937DRAFT_87461 [Endogone sp. FLAS-F59071]
MGKTKGAASAAAQQDDTRQDLTYLITNTSGSIASPSEDAITGALQQRFKRDLPYTRIGASTLVVVNPYKILEQLNDAALNEYADVYYRNTSGQKKNLQPHIYEMAARVYFHMRRTGENQSVVLR